MPEPPYRALRIFLRAFSLLAALGGLMMIFAEKPLIVRILLRPPEGEVSTLLLSLLKETGGMALMLSVLLWLASRNPVRNVAIVDALIAGLCILAVTPLLSLWMTDVGRVYPAYFLAAKPRNCARQPWTWWNMRPANRKEWQSDARPEEMKERERVGEAALSFAPVSLAPVRRLTCPDQQQNSRTRQRTV